MRSKIATISLLIILLGVKISPVIAGECDTPKPEWIFCDDFESGNLNKWPIINGSGDIRLVAPPQNSQIVSTPPNRTEQYVAQFHYVIPAGSIAHRDVNRYLGWTSPDDINHVFMRAYVLIPKDTTLSGIVSVQRKLFYIWNSSEGVSNVLTSFSSASTNFTDMAFTHIPGGSGPAIVLWDLFPFPKGKWVGVEVELLLNTPGSQNGICRIWIDDVLVYENLSLDSRGNSRGINRIDFGTQVDLTNALNGINEYRYFDNIVISKNRIHSLRSPDSLQVR